MSARQRCELLVEASSLFSCRLFVFVWLVASLLLAHLFYALYAYGRIIILKFIHMANRMQCKDVHFGAIKLEFPWKSRQTIINVAFDLSSRSDNVWCYQRFQNNQLHFHRITQTYNLWISWRSNFGQKRVCKNRILNSLGKIMELAHTQVFNAPFFFLFVSWSNESECCIRMLLKLKVNHIDMSPLYPYWSITTKWHK